MTRKTARIFANVMNAVRNDISKIKGNDVAKELAHDMLYNIDVALYTADTGRHTISAIPLVINK